MISLEVHGMKALHDQLQELGTEFAVRTLARAARKAFMPVLEAAQARVPVDTGLLKEHIRITVKKPKDGGDEVVVVGLRIARAKVARGLKRSARGGEVKKADPSWRWHFIEFGTSHSAAKPFLRPALDTNATRVIELLKTELLKSIKRAVARKARSA